MLERLQKVMAHAGVGSRRASEELIRQGRVTVNGQIANLGTKVDPTCDDIQVDGERLPPTGPLVYVMVHKPRGVISDEDVGGRRQAVRDLVPLPGHLYVVGRLDLNSEGLILLTNDGDLTHKLTHPRYEHPKVYHVLVQGTPTKEALTAWRRGVILDDHRTAPAQVGILKKEKGDTWVEVTLREGRKRQIRRVASMVGYPARRVIRVQMGPLMLGDLPLGAWRRLTPEEVEALGVIRTSRPRKRRP